MIGPIRRLAENPVSIKVAATTMVAMMGFIWVIWQFSKSYYETQIESLTTALNEVTKSYETLSKKAEGLFEPQLVKVDTIQFEKSQEAYNKRQNTVYFKGGLIEFTIKQIDNGMNLIWLKYINEISGLPYIPQIGMPMDEPLTRLSRKELILKLPNDIFDFSIDDQMYYLEIQQAEPASMTIYFWIYRLNPIYMPHEREGDIEYPAKSEATGGI